MENHLVTTRQQISQLAESISRTSKVGFDTESSGPQLVKANMINVYRSYMAGFSVAFDDGNAYYVPVGHSWKYNIPLGLCGPVFDALGKVDQVWAHNWKHDLRVLEQDNIHLPQSVLHDTMILHWMLLKDSGHEKLKYSLKPLVKKYLDRDPLEFKDVAEGGFGAANPKSDKVLRYACDDARNCLDLALLERNLPQNFDLEMYFMRVLYDMESAGMGIDFDKSEKTYWEAREICDGVKDAWDRLFPGLKITSPKVSEALFNPPVMGKKHKWSRTNDAVVGMRDVGALFDPTGLEVTSTGAVSFNKENVKTLIRRYEPGAFEHKVLSLKQTFQRYTKIQTTYTRTFQTLAAQYPDLRLHPSYHQTGTVTGRLSCSDPNFQNLPRDREDPIIAAVKGSIIPRPGYKLVSADYSQIELRVLAHMCGKGILWEGFQKGLDPHQVTADGVGIDRNGGKTLNFLVVYGGGSEKAAKSCGVSIAQGKSFIDRFYKAHDVINDLKKKCVHEAEVNGGISTLLGRFRAIPELQNGGSDRWRGERLALNTPIQGGAADIVKIAMIKMHKQLSSNHYMVAQVHDDLVFEIPEKDVDAFKPVLQDTMENAYKLSVPLVAQPAVGDNWLACK